MNIFENYLSKIISIVESNKDLLGLENLRNLNNINLEVPPEHFNFDLSTNISLILAKKNNTPKKTIMGNQESKSVCKKDSFSCS